MKLISAKTPLGTQGTDTPRGGKEQDTNAVHSHTDIYEIQFLQLMVFSVFFFWGESGVGGRFSLSGRLVFFHLLLLLVYSGVSENTNFHFIS